PSLLSRRRRPPGCSLFPYTTLFRSEDRAGWRARGLLAGRGGAQHESGCEQDASAWTGGQALSTAQARWKYCGSTCFSPPPAVKYSLIAASQRGEISARAIASWAASTSSASK